MSTTPARPPFIVSFEDVPAETFSYPNSKETFAFGRRIGRAAGLKKIGLHHERLPPGTRTSWPHAEESEEEFVYVIEGEVTAWIDGHTYTMKPGDLAAFPSGTGIAHVFINDTDKDAILLVGGEATKEGNRIYYPLHPHREQDMKPNMWWHDAPRAELGPHNGEPKPRT